MRRTLVNLVVDLSAAVLLLGMIVTGYILRFPLPPGTNKSHVLWGLTRHCWGSVHFWISAGLLGALLVHVVLHWQWLVSVVAKRFGRPVPTAKRSVQIGLVVAGTVVGVSALFAWITHLSVRPISNAELFGVCPPVEDARPQPARKGDGKDTASGTVSFEKDVRPIFQRSCLVCHGPKRARGGFRVDRREDFFTGTGGPLIVRGESARSPLIAIVTGERKDMPLPQRHKLPAADVRVLKAWIDAGAEWPAEENR